MRILVTAIGSMSAACVIKCLMADGNYVVGCDIYPKEWHWESKLCDAFYQAPYAESEEDYVNFLHAIIKRERLNYLIPLTDLEIDIIDKHRKSFNDCGVILCMQSSSVLRIVRNKHELYRFFMDDINVPSIKTCLLNEIPMDFPFPCIAKPLDGRSSEGLLRNATWKHLDFIENKESYIVQEQIPGDVFTVDYCRDIVCERDVSVPRKELIRTKNGAGLTVKTVNDYSLIQLVSYIGKRLNINGCINMEFIYSQGLYYLIDINPRFSAGVAFSVLAGYDMIKNHLLCFQNGGIDAQIQLHEKVMIKRYQEEIY